MDYLLKHGHRDLLVLGGDLSRSDISRERFQGCLDAFRENHLVFDQSRYYTCRYAFSDGYETMKKALSDGSPCTAVFAMADVIAIGASRAIREHGLRIPQDVSVMGYDGLSIGDFLNPRLSTIAQPTQELARRSAAILLEAIEQEAEARHEVVPFALSCKESAADSP